MRPAWEDEDTFERQVADSPDVEETIPSAYRARRGHPPANVTSFADMIVVKSTNGDIVFCQESITNPIFKIRLSELPRVLKIIRIAVEWEIGSIFSAYVTSDDDNHMWMVKAHSRGVQLMKYARGANETPLRVDVPSNLKQHLVATIEAFALEMRVY